MLQRSWRGGGWMVRNEFYFFLKKKKKKFLIGKFFSLKWDGGRWAFLFLTDLLTVLTRVFQLIDGRRGRGRCPFHELFRTCHSCWKLFSLSLSLFLSLLLPLFFPFYYVPTHPPKQHQAIRFTHNNSHQIETNT